MGVFFEPDTFDKNFVIIVFHHFYELNNYNNISFDLTYASYTYEFDNLGYPVKRYKQFKDSTILRYNFEYY